MRRQIEDRSLFLVSRFSGSAAARIFRVGPLVVVASLAVAAASSASVAQQAANGLPNSCPSATLIRQTLNLKVTTVTSKTEVTEYPYGSAKLPVAKPPRLVETCTYSASGEFGARSGIVPVTISFAELVSKSDFVMSRNDANQSIKAIVVKNLGDQAWLEKPPKFDPRAGSSLFVLTGTTDIVITAPPAATIKQVESLGHKLVAKVHGNT